MFLNLQQDSCSQCFPDRLQYHPLLALPAHGGESHLKAHHLRKDSFESYELEKPSQV